MNIDIQYLLMHTIDYGRRQIGTWYCVVVILFISQSIFGQCMLTGLDFEARLSQSDAILTGTLHQSQSYFKSDGNIYTEYLVVNGPDTTIVEKMGGTVGDLTQAVQPDASMHEGDVGILFVNKVSDKWSLACGPYSFVIYDTALDIYTDAVGQYEKEYLHRVLGQHVHQLKSIELAQVSASRLIPPTITEISPDTVSAGTETVVTITGFNFGSNATGQSAIELRNPDVGVLITAYQPVPPNHILSWSDKKIRFIVPGRDPLAGHAGAGSGVFRMKNNIGEIGYSPSLTVLYNRFIQGANQQMNLMNDNDKGGYTLTFNAAFKANADATLAYEKALETWQCENKSNITLAENTTTKNCPSNDGINLVTFDDACALSTGVLAQTTHWFITCSDGQPFFLEMDMVFDKQAKWSYTEENTDVTKFDFQSTALHELGHMHGIGHSLVSGNTMFPNVFPGTTRRTIDDHTKKVASLISNDSEAAVNTCSIARYKAGPSCTDTCRLQLTALSVAPCVNGLVAHTLNVINENTGTAFEVYIDGKLQSTLNYDVSGNKIFSVAIVGDAQSHTVTIKDKTNGDCAASVLLSGVDCSCKIDASLTTDGNCIGDSIVYTVNVTNTTNASQGYTVFVDDVLYLSTPYGSNNVKVAVIADGASHTIRVEDAIDVLCTKNTTVVTPMCRCTLDAELSFEECVDGKASYQLLLNHQNTGSTYQLYYNDLPIGGPQPYNTASQTTAFIDLPSNALGIFKVVDVDKSYCRVEENIVTQDCSCNITLEVSGSGDCVKDSVNMLALIGIENATLGTYALSANDIFLFNILVVDNAMGPINISFIQPANGSSGNVLKLVLIGNDDCNTTTTYDLPICQCSNKLKLLPLYGCDSNGNTNVKATLCHTGVHAATFDVSIGDTTTTYGYASGDSTIFNITLPGDGASYTIKVVDAEDTTCVDVETITAYNCACGLVANIVESGPCNADGTQTFYLRMDNNIKPAFVDVYVDGIKSNAQSLSTEIYDSLSYALQVKADGGIRTVKIQDKADTVCVSTILLETLDCRCFDIAAFTQSMPCDTSGFTLWAVTIDGLTKEVDIVIDGQYYQSIMASGQSTTVLLPLKGDGLLHTIEFEAKDGRCKKSLTLISEQCTCFSNLTLSAGDCDLRGKVPLLIEMGKSDYTTTAYLSIDGVYWQSITLSPTTTSTITTAVNGDGIIHDVQLVSGGGHCAINDTIKAPNCPCRIDVNFMKKSECDSEQNDVYAFSLVSTHFLADSFIVWLDGEIYTTFAHNTAESNFTLKMKSDGRGHNIRITNPAQTCEYGNILMTSLCPCSMNLTAFVTKPCITKNETLVYCSLNRIGGIGKEYLVYIDNVYLKNIPYSASGLDTFTISVLPDGSSHKILTRDEADISCVDQANIFSEKCSLNDCSLKFTNITTTPCSGNTTNLHIEFFAEYFPQKTYYLSINKALTSSNLKYDPSGINVLDFTVPCQELEIFINEGLDGECGIDTTINVKPHDGSFYYYPNPVNSDKTLFLDNIDSSDFDKLLALRFYDVVGREVASYDVLGKSKMSISLDRLPDIDGMYYFTLGSKRKYKGRVVVVH